jgi:hypothetical protein
MTSLTLRDDDSHKKSTINLELMNLLHRILKHQSVQREPNSERPTEDELIEVLLDHRRVRFLFHN